MTHRTVEFLDMVPRILAACKKMQEREPAHRWTFSAVVRHAVQGWLKENEEVDTE